MKIEKHIWQHKSAKGTLMPSSSWVFAYDPKKGMAIVLPPGAQATVVPDIASAMFGATIMILENVRFREKMIEWVEQNNPFKGSMT